MKLSKRSITLHVVVLFFLILVLGGGLVWVGQAPVLNVGVTKVVRDQVSPGLVLTWPNLQDSVFLFDSRGQVVHRWPRPQGQDWEYVEMLPNGDLLALHRRRIGPNSKGGELVRLDWEGNITARSLPLPLHHDFALLPNGNVIVLCREQILDQRIGPGKRLRSDYLLELSADLQTIQWRWNPREHLEEITQLTGIQFPLLDFDWKKRRGDWAHLNTVERIGPNTAAFHHPAFREGNLLISSRNLDFIAVVERPSGKLVWAWGRGELDGQHLPTMLPNGQILLFDNGEQRGYSRLVRYDPIEKQIVWQYQGSTLDPFYTERRGSVQALANGNYFVSEGDRGRLFEITASGEKVWEFFNSEAGQRDSRKRDRRIYRAIKYPPHYLQRSVQAAE